VPLLQNKRRKAKIEKGTYFIDAKKNKGGEERVKARRLWMGQGSERSSKLWKGGTHDSNIAKSSGKEVVSFGGNQFKMLCEGKDFSLEVKPRIIAGKDRPKGNSCAGKYPQQ